MLNLQIGIREELINTLKELTQRQQEEGGTITHDYDADTNTVILEYKLNNKRTVYFITEAIRM